MERPALTHVIDHTQLKPDADARAYRLLCTEAVEHRFYAVCVPGSRVAACVGQVRNSDVRVATVVGFPFGYGATAGKVAETRHVIEAGAHEVDMVIDIGALKDGQHGAVRADVAAVVEAAAGSLVKVIIECALLSDDEKRQACALAADAGAHFVKTSTGFAGGGATAEDVRLMRTQVGEDLGVKASGGIRTAADAHRMVEAGASRLGCSASVAIVAETADGA